MTPQTKPNRKVQEKFRSVLLDGFLWILKLDLAFDKVDWIFLEKIWIRKNFDTRWTSWMIVLGTKDIQFLLREDQK